MTTETETNRGRFFVTTLLPWLIAGGMLLLYLLTLSRSVTSDNIYRISELSGQYSPHRYFGPLTFLLTYPLHWVSAANVEIGLKLFTAICAALTLALLARTIILLPHDRTHEQRQREVSPLSLLTIPTAWLPPLFAALVCGLQMTFWENATNVAGRSPELGTFATDAPGQMLDLLIFAYAIRCLLEYRISFKLSWVARFAFAYGLGMANNWLMLGFFPAFLAALIWMRGLGFFNARLLGILALCGLAGLSLILLFPIQTALAHLPGFGFWEALRYILRTDKSFITALPKELLLLVSLTSLLPIFIIGIRWASYFGDTSQLGIFLTTFIFHIVHGVFFLACIWVAFDPPFSPRQKAYGILWLPLYYLGAISIGYFAGYFLLIFGVRPPKARHRPHPFIRAINVGVVAAVWILAVTVPVFQSWKNLIQLHASQTANAALMRLTSLTAEALPAQASVVLSDDRLRLLLLEHHSNLQPSKAKHLFLDTSLLAHDPFYIRALEKKYPAFNLAGSLTNWAPYPSFFEMIHFLDVQSVKHDLYYIHPSFGYFFERYYMVPHGVIYQLKAYDTNNWEKPALVPGQIEENQKDWKDITANELPIVTNLLNQPRLPVSSPILQYYMDTGHLTIESNKTAVLLGFYYARSLDYWGVALERASLVPEAGKCFAQCLEFNPNSLSAKINSEFNQHLAAGKKIVVDPPGSVRDKFGKFRSWTDLLDADGPFDDPSFCYVLGETFAAGENYREGAPPPMGAANYLQAIQEFNRVRALAPDYTKAAFWICKLYLRFGKNSDALAIADQVLQRNPNDPGGLFYKAVAFMQLRDYDKALPLLDRILVADAKNQSALIERAICNLELHHYDAAKADYEALEKVFPKEYRIDYGLQEVAFQQKDTNALVKYTQLYLSNYYQYFKSYPTNFVPPETEEVKTIKQRLKESKNGAP